MKFDINTCKEYLPNADHVTKQFSSLFHGKQQKCEIGTYEYLKSAIGLRPVCKTHKEEIHTYHNRFNVSLNLCHLFYSSSLY